MDETDAQLWPTTVPLNKTILCPNSENKTCTNYSTARIQSTAVKTLLNLEMVHGIGRTSRARYLPSVSAMGDVGDRRSVSYTTAEDVPPLAAHVKTPLVDPNIEQYTLMPPCVIV